MYRVVLNVFSKNMRTSVENFQVVLDYHRWVPLPAVGFLTSSFGEESQEDVTCLHSLVTYFIYFVSKKGINYNPCRGLTFDQLGFVYNLHTRTAAIKREPNSYMPLLMFLTTIPPQGVASSVSCY